MEEFPGRWKPDIFDKKSAYEEGEKRESHELPDQKNVLRETSWRDLSLAEWKELSNNFVLLFGILPLMTWNGANVGLRALDEVRRALETATAESEKPTGYSVATKQEDGKTTVRITPAPGANPPVEVLPDFVINWPSSNFSLEYHSQGTGNAYPEGALDTEGLAQKVAEAEREDGLPEGRPSTTPLPKRNPLR